MRLLVDRNIIASLVLVICLSACDSKRVFDSYKTIPNSTWDSENTVSFTYTAKDTIAKNNLFFNIRNNKKYAFSNIFVIAVFEFPNGKKIVDTLQYEMADNSGAFLGKGYTDMKESKLFYKEHVVFPVSGDYTVKISQAMRKNGEIDGIKSLEGITDIGFRIETSN